jgi:hypothetical protein
VLNALLAGDFIITVEDGTTYSKSGYIARLGGTGEHVELSEMSNLKMRQRTIHNRLLHYFTLFAKAIRYWR